METKKKKNPVIIILIVLFGIYLALFFASETGYYDYKAHARTLMTEEAMRKFEKDIEEGKDVTLNDYLEKEKKDYTNKISNLGLKTSESLEKFFTDGIGNVFKVLSKLVTD